jgi:hypothetical protein
MPDDPPAGDPDIDLPSGATALTVELGARTIRLNGNEQAVPDPWKPLVSWWWQTREKILEHPAAVIRLDVAVAAGTVVLSVTNPGPDPIEVSLDEGGFGLWAPKPDGSWAQAWQSDPDDRLGLITTTGLIVGGVLTPARLEGGAATRAAFVGSPPPTPPGEFFATLRGSLGPDPFALATDPMPLG